MAQGLAEALDLVIAPFGERQTQVTLLRPHAHELDGQRPCRPVVQRDTAPPPGEVAPGDGALDAGVVDAREGVPGVEKAVREWPVVREQEHALDVPVEAADRIQADLAGHEVGDDGTPLGVAEGGDVAAGLVEQHVPLRFGRRQRTAVDRDRIQLGIGQCGGTPRDGAVDGNVAVDDQAVTPPSRGQPRLRQDLVESQLRHGRRRPPAPG